jgi:hypothetical protein
VKHLKPVCHGNVSKATEFDDIMCNVATIVNSLLDFLGGASPLFLYIGDKCILPQPNTSGTGGTGNTTA